mmetsp:Transcript_27746/g.69226  ORF Transcript_27746/g.69226 Transcript_27746/m.69226 type:complete len:81 (+) Transcript_27746:524-766(+)
MTLPLCMCESFRVCVCVSARLAKWSEGRSVHLQAQRSADWPAHTRGGSETYLPVASFFLPLWCLPAIDVYVLGVCVSVFM